MKRARLERVRGAYPLADDDPRWAHGPESVFAAAVRAGATVVQLRLKHAADREALGLARALATRAESAGVLLVLNDRFDLADLSGAGGVHVGDGDLPPERIPEDLRERLVVGLSTHTLEQVEQSRSRPVDYVAFGPVFGTGSKDSPWDARGVEALARAVRTAGRPVVAIGGITPENVAEIGRAGASAFAVISAVAGADDPGAAITELDHRFRGADA